jgi:hypothetical protein
LDGGGGRHRSATRATRASRRDSCDASIQHGSLGPVSGVGAEREGADDQNDGAIHPSD